MAQSESTVRHKEAATFPALSRGERADQPAAFTARARRSALAASGVVALMAGILAGAALAPVYTTDPELATLLRFMALIKAGLAAGAGALAAWRFGSEISPRLAMGYTAAVALMALSPGLIWFATGLVLASALFHAGLLLGLAMAAGDGLANQRK